MQSCPSMDTYRSRIMSTRHSAVSRNRDFVASEANRFWRNSHAFTGFAFNIDRGSTCSSTNEEERNRYEDIDGSYFAQRVGEYGKEDRLLAGRIRNSLFRVPRCGSRYQDRKS